MSASDTVASTTEGLPFQELFLKYHNENAHSEHVTKLALQLFDKTRRLLHLSSADRPLLKAACRLHDIGYSADPRRHREKSAEIILREGLRDFSESDYAIIAAIVLLHSGEVDVTRQQSQVARLSDPQRACRLGAFLRIADGLDYGHLQDAEIVAIRTSRQTIWVDVCSPLFQYNLERVQQKADLWRLIFPLDIQFTLVPPALGKPSLLAPKLPILEAARRLILLQFKIIVINVEGALRNEDPKPLHDIRVAIRRLRAALWTFRKPLAKTSASKIYLTLHKLNQTLGPARDDDVWFGFLTDMVRKKRLKGDRRWLAFIRRRIEHRRRQQTIVRRALSGSSFETLNLKLSRLARLEMPNLINKTPSDYLTQFAQRVLVKKLRIALKLAELRHSDRPEDLHQLRKALRKARYLGEFFAPVLGPPFDKLTRRLHAAERPLGKIHDIDVGLARILRKDPLSPQALEYFAQQRRNLLAKLDKEWRRLRQFTSRHATML